MAGIVKKEYEEEIKRISSTIYRNFKKITYFTLRVYFKSNI